MTMNKERSILFSTPMVQAILEGRKTMTRRVITPPSIEQNGWYVWKRGKKEVGWLVGYHIPQTMLYRDARYRVGDILWVRETWQEDTVTKEGGYFYKADPDGYLLRSWKPSLFMPRKAARIFLEIKSVCVERLQDITKEDAIAEGFENRLSIIDGLTHELMEKAANNPAKANFIRSWNNLDRNHTGYDWEDNPWVWIIQFERIKS